MPLEELKLSVRITPEDLRVFREKAELDGLPVSQWARLHLRGDFESARPNPPHTCVLTNPDDPEDKVTWENHMEYVVGKQDAEEKLDQVKREVVETVEVLRNENGKLIREMRRIETNPPTRTVEKIVEKPVDRIVERIVEKPVVQVREKVVEKPVVRDNPKHIEEIQTLRNRVTELVGQVETLTNPPKPGRQTSKHDHYYLCRIHENKTFKITQVVRPNKPQKHEGCFLPMEYAGRDLTKKQLADVVDSFRHLRKR